jgi:hypothetical protein
MKYLLLLLITIIPAGKVPELYSKEIKPLLKILDIPETYFADSTVKGYICYDSLMVYTGDKDYKKVVLLYKLGNNRMIQIIREYEKSNSTTTKTITLFVKQDEVRGIMDSLIAHGFTKQTYQNWFQRLFKFKIKKGDFSKGSIKVLYAMVIEDWIYRDCTAKLLEEDYRGFRFTVNY